MTFGEMVALFATRAGLRKVQGLAEGATLPDNLAPKLVGAAGILSPLAKPIYRYIHTGDSLTQGDGDARTNSFGARDMTWQTALASSGALLAVRNGGVGGQPSPVVAARLMRDVIKFAPDVVGVTVGTNDVIVLNSSAFIAASLQAIHNALKSAGVLYFLTTIPPYASRASLVTAVNQIITGFCATNNVPLVDWYAIANDPANPGNYKANYSFDGTHPTTKVSKLFAEANWAAIAPYLTSTRKHQRPGVQTAANLLFPTTGITTAGAPASSTVRDGLFTNSRTLTQNGYSVATPYLWDTIFSSGSAPTLVTTVAPLAGVSGNVWTYTATPNVSGLTGSVTCEVSNAATPTIDVTRYQGRRLRFSFLFGASGLGTDNTDAYLAANANIPLSSCGVALAVRDKGGTVITNSNILDPVDSSGTLGQASNMPLEWGANPFIGPQSGGGPTRHCCDIALTPCNIEFNVPPGAHNLNIQATVRFLAGATGAVTMQLAEFMLVDVGPALYPQMAVNNDPLRFLKLTAAATLTQAQIISIDYYQCDAASAAFALTLPAANLVRGIPIIVKKTDSSANAVTVTANGSETIDGATTYALSSQYKYVRLVSNGAGWDVIGAG